MTENALDELAPTAPSDTRRWARDLIHQGFLDEADVAEEVAGYAEISWEEAEAMVAPLWAARLAEQESWPAVTDPDRLDGAFEALAERGVVTAMDFTCCGRCGFAEIGAEDGAEEARGFVFFHRQDTERAVSGGRLLLRYGAFDDFQEDREGDAAIGHEIVAALTTAGLGTEWDGSPRTTIAVTPLAWLRRLP